MTKNTVRARAATPSIDSSDTIIGGVYGLARPGDHPGGSDSGSAAGRLNAGSDDISDRLGTVQDADGKGAADSGRIVFDDVASTSAASIGTAAKGKLGSISGTLYDDRDGDGARDPGETAISNRTVFIDRNHNGLLGPRERSTITDGQGNYNFAGVSAGRHDVAQILPDYWRQTAPYDQSFSYAAAVPTTYQWVQIGRPRNELTLVGGGGFSSLDEGYAKIDIAPTTFYGRQYTAAYVSANGFISFEVPPDASFSNASLPQGAAPFSLIAPLWDDLSLQNGGHIYFRNDAAHDRFVVSWVGAAVSGGDPDDSRVTFQAIVGNDGSVTYQYQQIDGKDGTATIGVENQDGTAATQYAFNAASLDDRSSITFDPLVTRTIAPAHVDVTAGKATTGVDFGSHDVSAETGGVRGVAFDDVNGDGRFAARDGDVLKAGWTAFLDLNGNGRHDVGEATTVTDTRGEYEFATLDPGRYSVVMQAPFGWQHWNLEGTSRSTSPASASSTGMNTIDAYRAHVAETQADMVASGHRYAVADFDAPHVENELVVKFNPAFSAAAGLDGTDTVMAAMMTSVGATMIKSSVALGIQLWHVGSTSIADAAAKLMASGAVAYAEPNYIVHADGTGAVALADAARRPTTRPDDPSFVDEYGLSQIHAPGFWNYTTGSDAVIVGDIDSGIDLQHPDLIDNLWTNSGEIAGNGVDDDGNGYVDDIHGYDFANDDGDPDDDNGHGTHTSGTIGAQGDNGIGVSGVAWDVSLMALKTLDEYGSGTTFDTVLAVEYATMMGVEVTNNSYGGGRFNNALYDAIAAGGLFVAAAGNEGTDNDQTASYPASYDLDNIISVAAVDSGRHLANFSQYGATTVDLGAPGVNILSTFPIEYGSYATFEGTSQAAPHVAGAVALMMALFPDMPLTDIKAALLAGVQPLADLQGKTVTGGELDLTGALAALSNSAQQVTVSAGHVAQIDFAAIGTATSGNDKIQGYDIPETIDGVSGDDTIRGGGGNDRLIGGAGSDKLYGEAGADTFFFDGQSGTDTIFDFSHASHDKMRIDAAGYTSFDDLLIAADGAGGSLVSFGSNSIDVVGIRPGQLVASDFTFGGAFASPVMQHAWSASEPLMRTNWHGGYLDLHVALV